MANEYLKRTHTSSGNHKVATFSLWMKGQEIGSAQQKPIYLYDGSTLFQVFFERSTGTNPGSLVVYSSSTDLRFGGAYRDVSSWMHLVVSVDTTKSEADRISLYLNGSKLDLVGSQSSGTPNYPSQNAELLSNVQTINALNGSGSYQIFDYFFVDGQALTSDVFGFYKEGKGYQSSGTTQATDFRPGQWSPHSPRKIKTEIERKGGFGVNGFYLPMNDSSNVGADFHCTPNSIIKLKGEDLPQPRNGAPTTTDAYVSQLRSDPYAANLVLAVPGISTATGSNLITNGSFDSDVSGWGVSGGTFTWNNGRAQHVTTSNVSIYQQITGLTIGQRYTFQYTHHSGYTSAYISTNTVSSGSILHLGDAVSSSTIVKRGSFTATATSHYVVIYGIGSNTSIWDDVVVKQEDAPRDYSADIKGSGSNKTLTANGGAGVGYEIPSYYGSAITLDGSGDYFDAGSSSDFDFGSGDFTIEYWQNANGFGSTPGLGIWDDANNQRSWLVYQNTSARPRFYVSTDGTTSVSINASSPTIPNNQWTHFCMERSGSTLFGYVNGVCVGSNSNLGTQSIFTPADPLWIGRWASYYINGYIQDLRIYKGVAKYKGGFDVPKPYTPVGIDSWRQVSDTCKNNFATWNPLLGPQGCALADGNLTVTSDGVNNHKGTRSTMGMSSGKWYWEYRVGTVAVNSYVGVSETMTPNGLAGSNYILSGQGVNNYVSPNGAFSVTDSSMTTGMIIGCAFDRDASTQQLKVYKNGSLAVTGTSSDLGDGVIYLAHNSFNAAVSDGWEANFGQNPTFSGTTTAGTYTDSNGKGLFKYQPPDGYLALCEDNLPTPAIADPGEHFKTVLYTGTGSSRAVTGVGFKPDFIWCKSRTNTEGQIIFDSVRGPEKRLLAMGTQAEATSTGGVMSFDDDGYSTAQYTGTNQSGQDYVAWCWKAGGPAVTNTDGTITSQVSANQTAGFSIVKWTSNGNTSVTSMGHGLGKTPKFMIHKRLGVADNWFVYHSDIQTNNRQYLRINTTDATITSPNDFWSTSSSTMGIRQSSIAANGQDCIAYCWAEIEGYSKFGSYEGSGNADGPFVYCGFKPAWVMVKNADDTGGRNWGIQDSSRKSTNPCDKHLKADSSEVENSGLAGSTYQIDLLSNGFKVRNNTGIWNENNDTIIFAAFAESPFQTANAK